MSKFDSVFNDCKDYIEIIRKGSKGNLLIRGVYDKDIDVVKKTGSIDNRTPKNTPIEIHNSLNERYINEIGWPVRNGLFCYGITTPIDKIRDLGYGEAHLLFPCDGFTYAYDQNIFDLYYSHHLYLDKENNPTVVGFTETINYVNSNLLESMSRMAFEGNRSVEIIINCSNYYLIHKSNYEELLNLIWK